MMVTIDQYKIEKLRPLVDQEVHLLKDEFMRSRLPPKNTKDSQLYNAYSSKPIPIFIQSWVVVVPALKSYII